MKKSNFKKVLCLIAVLVIAVSLLLTACKPTVENEGVATVVVSGSKGTDVYEVPLGELENATGAISALDYLKAKGKLDYTSADSGFGAYLTKVGQVAEDPSKGIYVGIWTSVEKDFDTSDYATTKTYNGKTLTFSGVGISQMSLTDGCVIYIGEIIYN